MVLALVPNHLALRIFGISVLEADHLVSPTYSPDLGHGNLAKKNLGD